MSRIETALDLNSYDNSVAEIAPVPHRFREALGILAVRTTAIVGAAAAMLGVSYAAEAATETEPHAQAYSANEAEQSWCRWPSRWSLCGEANHLSHVAEDAAMTVSAEQTWSLDAGGADAVRHCYWNALMTREFGAETAQGFADRHESGPLETTPIKTLEQAAAERDMDYHNNELGRQWSTAPDLLQRCIDGVNNGELVRIRP